MERAINNDSLAIPKEGTVGYVKVESKYYEGPEIKPQLFGVGTYELDIPVGAQA